MPCIVGRADCVVLGFDGGTMQDPAAIHVVEASGSATRLLSATQLPSSGNMARGCKAPYASRCMPAMVQTVNVVGQYLGGGGWLGVRLIFPDYLALRPSSEVQIADAPSVKVSCHSFIVSLSHCSQRACMSCECRCYWHCAVKPSWVGRQALLKSPIPS